MKNEMFYGYEFQFKALDEVNKAMEFISNIIIHKE